MALPMSLLTAHLCSPNTMPRTAKDGGESTAPWVGQAASGHGALGTRQRADLAQSADSVEGVNENDELYAVGAATQKAGDRPRLFADGFTVSLK